jgi:hypothetical protein
MGSISDRLRAGKREDAEWATMMEKRLDAIDEMKAEAKPVIEREMQNREFDAQSLHSDALEMKKMADEIKGKNSEASQRSSGGSGEVITEELAVSELGTLPSQLKFNPEETRQ